MPLAEGIRLGNCRLDDLASALDAAHARGIIHRDIKTVNVLFDQSGRIVLGDFGLAKSIADSSGLTAAGTLMGTPMYLSPEQARGESLTPASDQFSLGVRRRIPARSTVIVGVRFRLAAPPG